MAKLSPLASVAETRAVLAAHGLSTKYSLGQNFLVNDGILQKITTLAQVNHGDYILEVGPGIGTLTIALLKQAAAVVSVERDPDLPAVLAETCAPWADRFHLVSKDALDLSVEDIPCYETLRKATQDTSALCAAAPLSSEVSKPKQAPPTGLPRKLVANLPYAVAATVILDYFERFPSLESATIMVQKEVADRMTAVPSTKNYGAYTVKLRLHAQATGRFGVGPGNFFPPPRVESAVVRLERRAALDAQGNAINTATLNAASLMAEAAFATRRKTLLNSCKTYFKGRGATEAHLAGALPQLFEQAGIDSSRRGETLDLDEFICLGKAAASLRAAGLS